MDGLRDAYWIGFPQGNLIEHRIHTRDLNRTFWDLQGGKVLRYQGAAVCGAIVWRTIIPWSKRKGQKTCRECIMHL